MQQGLIQDFGKAVWEGRVTTKMCCIGATFFPSLIMNFVSAPDILYLFAAAGQLRSS